MKIQMTIIKSGSFISPEFIVADNVTIGHNSILSGRGVITSGVTIGNNVCIDGDVTIGANTKIGHGTVITGQVVIGKNNRFHSYCVIGEPPMYPDRPDSSGPVLIGDSNVFREFVTINAPALTESTKIGDHCYFMGYVHISHDCHLANHVKMAMNSTLAGSVTIGDYSYIGMHAAVHQRLIIGPVAMVGMANAILKNVPPFAVVHSGQFKKINTIGLGRLGYSEDEIESIKRHYHEGSPCSEKINAMLVSFDQVSNMTSTYSFAATSTE